jgi:hypothetical protein
MNDSLTDLLHRLPDATRRDRAEWDDEFWRRVAERLSNVAWDEQGNVVDLRKELPNLVLEALTLTGGDERMDGNPLDLLKNVDGVEQSFILEAELMGN